MTTQKGAIYEIVEKYLVKQTNIWTQNEYEFWKNQLCRLMRTELLPKIQELEPVWIPVEERLPEMYVRVFVKTTYGIFCAEYISETESYEEGGRTYYYWWSEELGDELDEVTHYMVIPD